MSTQLGVSSCDEGENCEIKTPVGFSWLFICHSTINVIFVFVIMGFTLYHYRKKFSLSSPSNKQTNPQNGQSVLRKNYSQEIPLNSFINNLDFDHGDDYTSTDDCPISRSKSNCPQNFNNNQVYCAPIEPNDEDIYENDNHQEDEVDVPKTMNTSPVYFNVQELKKEGLEFMLKPTPVPTPIRKTNEAVIKKPTIQPKPSAAYKANTKTTTLTKTAPIANKSFLHSTISVTSSRTSHKEHPEQKPESVPNKKGSIPSNPKSFTSPIKSTPTKSPPQANKKTPVATASSILTPSPPQLPKRNPNMMPDNEDNDEIYAIVDDDVEIDEDDIYNELD